MPQVVQYLLDIGLESYTSLIIPCSRLAAAAVWMACVPSQPLAGNAAWSLVTPQQLERLTGYSDQQLQPCCTFLQSLCKDAQHYPTLYVNRKHAAVRAFTSSLLNL